MSSNAARAARLAGEQLHGRDAADVLLQEGVDARDPHPHLAIGRARVNAEPVRHQHDARDHREGDQRQAPVEQQHRPHDGGEGEDVAEHRHHTRREQLVERIDVGRHPRHQPPHRIAVVETDVEPLQVRVDLAAQVEHDALPGHLQRHGLDELEAELGDERRQIERRRPAAARPTPAPGCKHRSPAGSATAAPVATPRRRESPPVPPAPHASTAPDSAAAAASAGGRRICREDRPWELRTKSEERRTRTKNGERRTASPERRTQNGEPERRTRNGRTGRTGRGNVDRRFGSGSIRFHSCRTFPTVVRVERPIRVRALSSVRHP